MQRSRGTGPRATAPKNVPSNRRARDRPSPCVGLSSKHPWFLGCGRFPPRLRDRGGQAPALRHLKTFLQIVGRGPVPRHANRLKQDLQDYRIYKIIGFTRLGTLVSNRCRAAGKRCFRSVGPEEAGLCKNSLTNHKGDNPENRVNLANPASDT